MYSVNLVTIIIINNSTNTKRNGAKYRTKWCVYTNRFYQHKI